jgi:chaperone modulatory protein CbpM
MKPPLLDMAWLNERQVVTQSELARICAMRRAELDELVDYGALTALVPLNGAQPERTFSTECVMPLRTASQLRHDFVLDLFMVAVLMVYLRRIESLEQQVRSLSGGDMACGVGWSSGSAKNI